MHRIGEKRRLTSDSLSDVTYFSESPPKKKKYLPPEATPIVAHRSRLYGLYQRVSDWVMSIFSLDGGPRDAKVSEVDAGVQVVTGSSLHDLSDWNMEQLIMDGSFCKDVGAGRLDKAMNIGGLGKVVNTEDQGKVVDTEYQDKVVDTEYQDKVVDTEYQDKVVDTGDQDKVVDTGYQDKVVDTGDQDYVLTTGSLDRAIATDGLDKENVPATRGSVFSKASKENFSHFSSTPHEEGGRRLTPPKDQRAHSSKGLIPAVDQRACFEQTEQDALPFCQRSQGRLSQDWSPRHAPPLRLYSPLNQHCTIHSPVTTQSSVVQVPRPLHTTPHSTKVRQSSGVLTLTTANSSSFPSAVSRHLNPLRTVPLFQDLWSPTRHSKPIQSRIDYISTADHTRTDHTSREGHTLWMEPTSMTDHTSTGLTSMLTSITSPTRSSKLFTMPFTLQSAGKLPHTTSTDTTLSETTSTTSIKTRLPNMTPTISTDRRLPEAMPTTPVDWRLPETTLTISTDRRLPEATPTTSTNKRLLKATPATSTDIGRPEVTPNTCKDVDGERNGTPLSSRHHFMCSRKTEVESLSNWIQDIQSGHKYSQAERLMLLEVAHTKLELCKQQRQEVEDVLVGRLRQSLQESHLQPHQVMPWQLSPEQMDQVAIAMDVGNASECLSERYRIRICHSDLCTLEPTAWLNDEVMNFYFNLVQEHCNQSGNLKLHIFNSFFYLKLTQSGYSGVRRWTKKVDLFECDLILLPVHLGMHWCLALVDMRTKQFLYLDSLLGSNITCLQRLRDYLMNESLDKKKVSLDLSDWTDVIPKDIPRQQNSWDCGVFTCMYARHKALQRPFTFCQGDMPAIRRLMVYEILQQKLQL